MKENKPIRKERVGRFQVTIWKNHRLIKARNDYDVEREVETVRGCIQHSTYNKTEGTWRNQSIWVNAEELRDLAQLLDQFDQDDEELPDKESGGSEALR
jgi:hypothetical protein